MSRAHIQWTVPILALVSLALCFRIQPELPTDLDPPLIGTAALFHGSSPYSQQTTETVQLRMYGHRLSHSDILNHHDQHRFVYPLYSAFLLYPLSTLPLDLADYVACGIFAIAIALSVPLWLRVTEWKVPASGLAVILALVFLSPISQRGLWLNQLALLIMFFLAAASFAVRNNRLFLAGAVLAVATIKPQLALLPIVWFGFWALADPRRRWPLLAAFSSTLLILIGASQVALPGWMGEFLRGISEYRSYTGAPSAFDALFGKWSVVPTALMIGGFIWMAWSARRHEPSSLRYRLALALACAATPWAISANWDAYNQLMSLPALFLLGRIAQDRRRRGHRPTV